LHGRTQDEIQQRADELVGWIEAGRLDVRIGDRFPLGDAATGPVSPEDCTVRHTAGENTGNRSGATFYPGHRTGQLHTASDPCITGDGGDG
ncbi:MAG: hypothetical protein SVX28_05880, partial [Pseudomonadota bacterium]|nr:hypothetical protein [Pseudomonadota bacterium]